MKSTFVLTIAALCAALAVIQPIAMATPVVAVESSPLLEKRILEQCKNKTGVCVSREACVGTGFDGKERHIDGLCDKRNSEFICCINF
ncbi:hypothetical protein BGZ88_000853 [Linnemannia elongata]|uniref:Uncharacterized protein n=1 Tax=Linnemannia elongata AG-77 TaxID=1314771 RepID=A0A197K7Q0_9FUNG|nr:hypothetical protein BGZ88_000853 [Linnemannia elongata]OAQ33188.1 hypothetical protein K457DRAFT_134809 [Linnemannia elongata AG-77]